MIAFGWQASIRQAQALSDTTAPTLDRSKTPAVAQCLTTGTGRRFDAETETLVPVAFDTYNQVVTGNCTQTLCSRGDSPGGNAHLVPAVATTYAVRRLTPIECERLQGFPDNWTRIPWRGKPAEECPDGPRYKAVGNSMAVPVMNWIGQRIQTVEAIG